MVVVAVAAAAANGAEMAPSGPAAGRRLAGLRSAPSSQGLVLLLFRGRPRLLLLPPAAARPRPATRR